MRTGTVVLAAATWAVVAGIGAPSEGRADARGVDDDIREFSLLADHQAELPTGSEALVEPGTCAPAVPAALSQVRGLPRLFARHGGLAEGSGV